MGLQYYNILLQLIRGNLIPAKFSGNTVVNDGVHSETNNKNNCFIHTTDHTLS